MEHLTLDETRRIISWLKAELSFSTLDATAKGPVPTSLRFLGSFALTKLCRIMESNERYLTALRASIVDDLEKSHRLAIAGLEGERVFLSTKPATESWDAD